MRNHPSATSGSPRRMGARGLARLSAGRWLPLLLLLTSLGVAAVAIVQAQQSSRSHRATAEGLLRDYAAFAAWSYRQRATTLLTNAFHQTLDPVHHDRHRDASGAYLSPEVLWARQQQDVTDSTCVAVRPGAPYYFRLAPDGQLTIAGPPPSPAVQHWLARTIPPHARARERQADDVLISGVMDNQPHHIVYTAVGGEEDPLYVYGFELEPSRYQTLLRAAFKERPLLPGALMNGRENAELLAVRVVASTGEVLYQSDAEVPWALGSSETLSSQFGGLTVHAVVRPEIANSLIIGGLPRSRLPYLFGLFLLSAALAAVAAGQVRREGQLARLRSDFVSSVSHELRTPLAQVRLFLETLRLGRYSTDEQREWILGSMERETTRLTTLIDNVLHFSRAERGAVGGDREPVELARYLRQVVEAFAPLAASRGVRFEVDAEPGLTAALHRESFRQVILNLLDNAVKYGPPGQRVGVIARAAGEDRVQIAVEDEGPGVGLAERARIWEPFRRGERAIGSVAVGSGIGLAVVREIVRWHGGRAWVEEAAEGGARFVLEIPGSRLAALPLVVAAPAEDSLLRKVG